MNRGRCRLPWRSRIQLVSSDRTVEFKNNKQKMFQQHLGTVSSTMTCFNKRGLCFTFPTTQITPPEGFLALLPHIMEIYSISEMFRNFIDRFWVWIGKLFQEALFSRVLCKTKDLQQSSIVSALNKIFETRESLSEGMNWKGLMDWMNSTCRSLTRPNVNWQRPFFFKISCLKLMMEHPQLWKH